MKKQIIEIILFILCILVLLYKFSFAEKIIYNPEYVSQFLGQKRNISFIDENHEYNKINMLIIDLHYESNYKFNYKKQWQKIENYFIIGESTTSYKIKININKIIHIE